ncbi:MAG: hypothetical protein K9N55_02375 [Phycisphaerae bacterium]|nr:hypothetical protein [Phycisphaerae bacterium]
MMRLLMIIIVVMGMQGFSQAQSGQTWAVLASGLNKDPDENRSKTQAILKFQRFLLEVGGVSPERLIVCMDPNSFAATDDTQPNDRATLRQTLHHMARSVTDQDRFIFYYVGQANRIQKTLRFNLPGPDLNHADLVQDLNAIHPERMMVILDCPCAGLLMDPLGLGQKNRVIIAGAGSDQPLSTRFSQYFIPALSDPLSDSNQDTRISVLEAFRVAVQNIDTFYEQRDLVATENPLLEDDADGIPSQRPWTFVTQGKDGQYADQWFFQ